MALSATILLIGKLGTILENERTTIAGVRGEVDKIKLELQYMKAFIEDEEANNKIQTEVEKMRFASIRDLAYDAGDIIDEFMYHMYEKQSGGRISRVLHKTIHAPNNLWFRRKTAKKLQKITEKIIDSADRHRRYIDGRGATKSDGIHILVRNLADYSYSMMEEEVVGIEGKKQLLMRWLMDEGQHRTVTSVVGMGGSGKTTLVANTFKNERIKRHFDFCAWITVSQTYVVADLFRSLIMEIYKSRQEDVPANMSSMSSRDLIEILTSYLEFKRYLVVLDDVWDIEVWEGIKVSLQDRQNGSRIVLTTRNEEVVPNSFGVGSHVHHIQPLQRNEAWELFSKKAFSTHETKTCPSELKSVACQLVEKCEGLPLAIVALGGLMSPKKLLDEWEKAHKNLNWHLDIDPSLGRVKKILLLSFNDLSSRLKHCFLYCSLFPEDYFIKRKRLIRLWIGEGFVEHVKGATPEEVADGYLLELCFRSMLQVVQRNGAGRPKEVKMHDLMRELALSTAEEEKFGLVHDKGEVMKVISSLRLSIQKMKGEIKSCTGMPKIRSLLVFSTDMSSVTFSNTLVSQFKLLRTLDLEDLQIDILPNAVVTLFNLRYLNLKGTLIKELPKSIGRLRNLQILNITNTMIESLPQGITKLLNLRHLVMYRYCGGPVDYLRWMGKRVPSSICKLQKLQCLTCIESKGETIRLIGNLTQLRTIGITNVKEKDENDLQASIEKLTLLRSLDLMASNEEEILPVNAQCAPLPHLQKLYLCGRLQNVTPWFSSLHSLTALYLNWTRLEDDILPELEALPHLTMLYFYKAYVGEQLCFRRGFVKLMRLQLHNHAALEKISIEKGAMPNLQSFWVERCMELKMVPQGVEFLSNLQTLGLAIVPAEILQPIRRGGTDRSKVQHIPEIRHVFQQSSMQWVSENLA